MTIVNFSNLDKGILFKMLQDAYSLNEAVVLKDSDSWLEFDSFVYDNIDFMDKYGFITVLDNEPIGFISWDPRKLPEHVEIGHNCIIKKHEGNGYGKKQMIEGINIIKSTLKTHKIIVITNNEDFFIPAQKMYEAAGFKRNRIIKRTDEKSPELIEYSIEL